MLHPGGSDNESAYRVLIDRNEFHQGGQPSARRGHRTKSLLSGGFGKPRPPAGYAGTQPQSGLSQQNLWMHNRQQAPQVPTSATMTPFLGGGLAGAQSTNPNSLAFMNRAAPQPASQYPSGFLNQNRWGQQSTAGYGGYGGYGRGGYGQGGYGHTGAYGSRGAYGATGYNKYGKYDKYDKHYGRRRKHKSRHKSKNKKWYDGSSDSSSASSASEHGHSRRSRHHSREDWWKSSSESDSDSESSDGGDRRRSRDRYGMSDSESDHSEYDTDDSRHHHHRQRYDGLNSLQKKMVLNTIRDYCPDNMHNAVYEDLMSQMELLDKKGYKLPKGYDKRKHDLSENEIRLYEQQLQRDKSRDQKKMSYMINFSALGLSWFCQCISVDWIKTRHLPEIIRTALEDGEFDDCLEGIGMYLRGTVFDNPVFSTILKFVEKIGEAHHMEMEEDQDKLEEAEERKEMRHAAALRSLNKFRQPGASEGAPVFDVPAPDAVHTKSRSQRYEDTSDSGTSARGTTGKKMI